MPLYEAYLILGPTGSGKTPLGDYIAAHGVQGRRCVHFDFGANLRAARAAGAQATHLRSADIETIARVLDEGALLEDDEFHIALGIFNLFASGQTLTEDDLVILNGVPRHAGQADDIAGVLDVCNVLVLHCTPDVIQERIRLNTGGDRMERDDDSIEEIQRKLKVFEARTQPLIDYYRGRDVVIQFVDVDVNTQPADILDASIATRHRAP